MPIKVSEKKLLLGITCVAAAISMLIQTTVVVTPVRLSEKGLFFSVLALGLLILGVRFFKRALIKA